MTHIEYEDEYGYEYEGQQEEQDPEPGDWCMDCGLFGGLDGKCGKCGRDTEDFREVKENEFCTKCGRRNLFTLFQTALCGL